MPLRGNTTVSLCAACSGCSWAAQSSLRSCSASSTRSVTTSVCVRAPILSLCWCRVHVGRACSIGLLSSPWPSLVASASTFVCSLLDARGLAREIQCRTLQNGRCSRRTAVGAFMAAPKVMHDEDLRDIWCEWGRAACAQYARGSTSPARLIVPSYCNTEAALHGTHPCLLVLSYSPGVACRGAGG